jgi:hypothetical protein
MFELLAVTQKDLGGGIRGIGVPGLENVGKGGECASIPLFVDIMSKIIGILTIAAILWFIIQFILGGFRWITASGDAKEIENARMQIIHAIVGLVIVFSALIILSVIGLIFGIKILDMEALIKTVGISSSCGTGLGGTGAIER